MSGSFLDNLTGAYSGLRRTVIDPETGRALITSEPTGEVVQRSSVLPIGRDDGGRLVAAVPGLAMQAVEAARFPGQVYRGEASIFDLATGHVSDEAIGKSFDLAGTAMTGSLPFKAPKGALRMFGGAAEQSADDVLGSLEAALKDIPQQAPPPGPRLLDPQAKSWDVFHGSPGGEDFARFDPARNSNPHERAVFFAPSGETASDYAGKVTSGGEAGARVFRATVDPGKTGVFDLTRLAETDPAFNARAREITVEGSGAVHGPSWDEHMADFRAARAQDADIARQVAELGFTPDPNAGTRISYGHGHIGAAIERARAQGLDTAILRGLVEHGGDDQAVALTPGRVRSAYSGDLLYSTAPTAIGAGSVAAAAIANPGEATAAPSNERKPMPGLFDDLVPAAGDSAPQATPPKKAGGLFDDLVPAQAERPAAAHPMTLADGTAPPSIDEATKGQDVGALGAGLRGVLNGIPVAGPAIVAGVERTAAGIGALKNGEAYSDSLGQVQANSKATAEAHPYVTTGSEIAGAVAGTAPLVAAAPAAFGVSMASLPLRAAISMLTNGALGAADGAVRSGGDLEATAVGGGLGAVGGAAAPYLGRVAGKAAAAVASKIKPAAAVPAVTELKTAARTAYQRADDAGVQVAQPSFAAAVDDIAQAAKEAGIDKTIHPKATAAVGRLTEAAGTAPTLADIEILRRVVKGAGSPLAPDEQRIASLLVDKLDDYVGGLKQGDLISGDAATAADALGEARNLWGRARRAEIVEDAVTRGENRAASTGSGGNAENAVRQNIRAILDSPKKRAGFTDAEKAAMQAIVRGSSVQNALRLMGKFSPTNGALMAMLGLSGTAVNPAMAVVPAAGLAAKTIADRGARRQVQRLGDLVRSGGQLPVSPLALPAQQAVEPLAINIFSALPRLANQ